MIPNYTWKSISGWINYSGMVKSYKMNENEMGYRGSKSVFKLKNIINLFTVKEQRVDGSYFGLILKIPRLRCTLTGCENNYQVKIPSKQFNISSSQSAYNLNVLSYPTKNLIKNNQGYRYLSNNACLINPWWITGFTDAEGSFQISVRKDTRQKINWRVGPAFQIKLHIKDISILEEIKNTLGVGTITKDKFNTANFNVWSIKELEVIIDHFDKFPLVTAKHSDYILFKKCFEIIKNREHLTKEGLIKILELKSYLNLGLSEKVKEAFPDIIPNNRPEYKFKGIPNPWWISGFVSGDGSFYLHVNKRNSKVSTTLSCLESSEIKATNEEVSAVYRKVVLSFAICLHSRDEKVLLSLVEYFKTLSDGATIISQVQLDSLELKNSNNKSLMPIDSTEISKHIYKSKSPKKSVTLYFRKFSEIVNIIIPFFDKYPLRGYKKLDFLDFKNVSKIVKCKEHLTFEGFKKIENINATMNQRRPWS